MNTEALDILDGLYRAISRRTQWLGWMSLQEERRVMRVYRYLQVRKARKP